jgi:hypothetical protein
MLLEHGEIECGPAKGHSGRVALVCAPPDLLMLAARTAVKSGVAAGRTFYFSGAHTFSKCFLCCRN